MGTLSADHVRTFLMIVEKGSFSAAAKALRRSQTAISYSIINLENQLGVQLFDRAGRRPVLTAAGRALVADAKLVTHSLQSLRLRAESIARGIEAELAIVIDAFYPLDALIEPMRDFVKAFPRVEVTLRQEMVGTVINLMLGGACSIGILSHVLSIRPEFAPTLLAQPNNRMVAVVAANHPLAARTDAVSNEDIAMVAQIVPILNTTVDFGTLSQTVCRCSDLHVMRVMILAGIGWSAVPHHMVAEDLAAGRMVVLNVGGWVDDDRSDFKLSVIHRTDALLGPAAHWLIERLAHE